ncbi:MAG: DsbA family protein [Nitrosopumilaceae archaeon]|nr:DsbA family protein [Nitrosopumilaceae archaeon]
MYQEQPDQLTQEDLDDALAKLELKMMQQQMAALQQQQQQPPAIQISADDDPTIGDADAPITIIEFSDFQCPFCARFSSQTLPSIQEEYIDKGLVKLVYRDFPLQHIHPNAAVTALAAECADDQGGFKGMHDILFEKQSEWNRAGPEDIIEMLSGYASDTGIDAAEFEECVVMGTHIEDIKGDLEDGRSYGVTGTPGFFIGNDDVGYVSIEGAQPYDVFKRVIDSQLER